MNVRKLLSAGAVCAASAIAVVTWTGGATGQMPPFGNPEDIAEAKALWDALAGQKLVGGKVIHSKFYEGTEPHGFVLETLDSEITVNGHTGVVVVKRNYGPSGVEPETVANDPQKHLAAITVMFRREAGYDADNKNWFWAKYLPDGALDQNPKKMSLAGRVAKGNDEGGCISCHKSAPGGDYLFITDRIK